MDVFLLDNSLNRIAIIDNYTSLIWANRYFTLGDCEVYIKANYDLLELLDQSIYISRDDDDMVCRIEKIQLTTDTDNGDYLTITGTDVKKILNQRIVWNQTIFKGKAERYLYTLVNRNIVSPKIASRKISNFTVAPLKGLTNQIQEQVTYTNLGEKIQEIVLKYGWGYKVTVNDSQMFVFEVYNGTDRSNTVMFSDTYENLISTTYTEDNSNIANVFLVAGEGEGSKRKRVSSGTSSGINRYEIYVDAKDISSNVTYDDLKEAYPNGTEVKDGDNTYYVIDGEMIAKLVIDGDNITPVIATNVYNTMLLDRGSEKLAEHISIKSFEGSIEPTMTYVYKQDYYLGDIVNVRNQYGISLDARITEVIESWDENGYKIEPKFEYLEEI